MSPRARKQPQTSATATMAAADTAPIPQSAAPTSPESRLDRIAQRAYAIYERRGGQGGGPMDDWLQAEREIDSET